MYKIITNFQDATQILHFDFSPSRYVPENGAQALKFIDLTDGKVKFAWGVFANKQKVSYVGYSPTGTAYSFKPEQIIEWHPYNGEFIEDFFEVRFDLKGNFRLEILPILDEEEADKILSLNYPHITGEIKVFNIADCSLETRHTAGVCWYRQLSEYHFLAINMASRKIDVISRHQIEKYYSVDSIIKNVYVVKKKDEKLKLIPIQ